MNVSSVKNLNGSVFSAVQDAELTEVVQTNSGNWQDITAYQNASATYLTAHQDISNLMPKSDSANFYPMEGNPSGFLITHQAISADEWNSNYETVNTNSGVWGGSALPVSAGQGVKINLVDNTLVFSNDETVLWSGTMTWGQNGSLSDSVKNYERIRFDIEETNRHRKSVNEMPLTDLSNANLREFSLNLLDATTGYFGNYFTVYQVNEAGTSITSVSGRQWWYNPWTSTAINGSTDRGLILKKVTGINKIAGGN